MDTGSATQTAEAVTDTPPQITPTPAKKKKKPTPRVAKSEFTKFKNEVIDNQKAIDEKMAKLSKGMEIIIKEFNNPIETPDETLDLGNLVETEEGFDAPNVEETDIATDKGKNPEKLKELAFMNQIVEMQVPFSDDDKTLDVEPVWVNGVMYPLKRGMVNKVPRFVADSLFNTIQETIAAKPVTKGDDITGYKYPRRGKMMLNFTIVNDNPEGQAWTLSKLENLSNMQRELQRNTSLIS